jgi:transcriptional regulator with XRE-family HTH domain
MALFQHEAVSVNIGERLRELREARNISMRALATRSGLSATALPMLEKRRIKAGRNRPSMLDF